MTEVNIGCNKKKINGFINIDINPNVKPDIVMDATDLKFKDNSIDFIISIHCIEHVKDPDKMIEEIHRVLKVGGLVELTMPYAYGRIALAKEHINQFKARDFYLYEKDNRNKSNYQNINFEILEIRYIHNYPKYMVPFWAIGCLLQFCLDNFGRKFRESYECQWGWVFPMESFTIIMMKA